MSEKSIVQVAAENIRQRMEKKEWKQEKLGAAAGMGQTTVGLFLSPDGRKPGKSGKPPSGTITNLAAIAAALGCEAWELLAPASARAGVDAFERALREVAATATIPGMDTLMDHYIKQAKARLSSENSHASLVREPVAND